MEAEDRRHAPHDDADGAGSSCGGPGDPERDGFRQALLERSVGQVWVVQSDDTRLVGPFASEEIADAYLERFPTPGGRTRLLAPPVVAVPPDLGPPPEYRFLAGLLVAGDTVLLEDGMCPRRFVAADVSGVPVLLTTVTAADGGHVRATGLVGDLEVDLLIGSDRRVVLVRDPT